MKHPLYLVMGGVFALFIAMSIGRFAYTPILPFMQLEKGFSTVFAGTLASANYAGYLAGAIAGSILPIQTYRRKLLLLSLASSISLTFAMGLVESPTVWILFRFVSGVTSAFVFVLTSSIILDRLAAIGRIGLSGVMYAGVGLGIFVSGLVVAPLVERYSSDGAWIGLGFIALLLAMYVVAVVKEPESSPPSQAPPSSKRRFEPWLIWLLVAYGLEGLGYIITGTFIVAIAEQSSVFAGSGTNVWAIVGLAAVPSTMIWAFVGNRFGWMKSFAALLTIQATGVVLPAISQSPVSFYLSAILFGATFMGVTVLVASYAREKFPHASARILSVLTVTYALGQMMGPILASALAEQTGSYSLALVGAAAVIALGALCTLPIIYLERQKTS
ncbi:MFS family permease [Chryseomicrobium aureum]|uniref:YbfB/YjiJ family MFS transporter n=1 Tax=Chryseomicrobium aureum TaxID=1441723 RepID=UPI001957D80B|nr:YbfB/YjiJ family MFS transporter [Chryseomicrobium aureum]MBM7705853.1 MFS family permease [Chryseomicrobium aureum]